MTGKQLGLGGRCLKLGRREWGMNGGTGSYYVFFWVFYARHVDFLHVNCLIHVWSQITKKYFSLKTNIVPYLVHVNYLRLIDMIRDVSWKDK